MKKLLPLLIFTFTLILPLPAQSKVWNYTEITVDTPKNNRGVTKSGNDIVWSGYDENGKYSMMHHDLSTGITRSLTAGKVTGALATPTVHDGMVVFRSYDRANTQNYYAYDLKTDTVTHIYSAPIGSFPPSWGYPPSYGSLEPMVHNGQVTFAAWDGEHYQIMLWDKENGVSQITHDDYDSYEPQIWNGQLCWTGWGGDATKQDVFYWDGSDIHQITSRRGKDEDTYIADGKIYWTGQSYEIGDGSFNVYSYDIETGVTELAYDGPNNNLEPVGYQNTFAWHSQQYYGSDIQADYKTYYSDGYKVDELIYFDSKYNIGPYMDKDTVLFSSHDGTSYQIIMASYKTGGYNPEKQNEGAFRGSVTVGQTAYFAQGTKGIGVYDLSDPSNPTLITRAKTDGDIHHIVEQEGTLYTASREAGLEIYDISTPDAIRKLGNVEIEGSASKLLLRDDKIFVGGRHGGLSIVDIANNALSVIGHVSLPGITLGLDILNNIGYVAGYNAGLHLVDLSDPTNPTLLKTLSNIGKIWDVNIHNNTAFLSVAGYGLLAYDLTKTIDPLQIGALGMPNGDANWLATFEMIIRDNIAFVSAGTQGIFAVDIKDPSNMFIIERYETPEFAWSAEIIDKLLVGSDYTDGFNIYDISDHLGNKTPSTPIPASAVLLSSGLAGLAWLKKRKN